MKYAVVLGASTGVGSAVARCLAEDGWAVIGFHRGRHREEAQLVEETIGGHYGGRLIELDVGRTPEQVVSGVRRVQTLAGFGGVAVLVHSLSGAAVGTLIPRPRQPMITPEKIEQTFNQLAHSFLWWVQELYATETLSYGAHLIALTNPCTDFYLRNSGVIGAAKAALESYVRSLAAELGPRGYRVNAVKFSTVLTPALRKVLQPEAIEKLEELHKHIVPGGRMQTADDVAGIVSRLVQDTWTNGAILDHTGGSPMMLMDYAFNGGR